MFEMDKCREAFERFECEKYEANYDDMKKNWDWYESQFGYRYSPDSLRGKDWAIWQKAWQHRQAKVDELQKRVDQQGLIIAKAMSIASDLQKSWSMFEIGKKLEQALKGEG